MRILLSIAAAAALAVGLSGQASAAAHHSSTVAGPAGQHNVVHVPPPGSKSLLVGGFSGADACAGCFTAVDSGETITCKNTCSISGEALVQLSGNAGTGVGEYALCLVVDGTYATCPYAGNDTSNFFITTNQLAFITNLAPGTHTVQEQVYVTNDSTIYNYYIRYDQLK